MARHSQASKKEKKRLFIHTTGTFTYVVLQNTLYNYTYFVLVIYASYAHLFCPLFIEKATPFS